MPLKAQQEGRTATCLSKGTKLGGGAWYNQETQPGHTENLDGNSPGCCEEASSGFTHTVDFPLCQKPDHTWMI